MTTSAQRLTYYSWRHWRDQEEAIYKYLDPYSYDVSPFEIDGYNFHYRAADDSRRPEVLQSARERAMYCHVNKFKMLNDSLKINGVAFGLMLDDERKRLHENITYSYARSICSDAISDLIRSQSLRINDRAYDREIRYRSMSITERCFDIMREVARLSLSRYAPHPIYASYDKGVSGGDETVITVVGEYGREVLTNEEALTEIGKHAKIVFERDHTRTTYTMPAGFEKVYDDLVKQHKNKSLLQRIATWSRKLFPILKP